MSTAPPLCLDPDPHLTRIVNSVLRVTAPPAPPSLKRKAAAMEMEEDEMERTRRAKIIQYMNPRPHRSTVPRYGLCIPPPRICADIILQLSHPGGYPKDEVAESPATSRHCCSGCCPHRHRSRCHPYSSSERPHTCADSNARSVFYQYSSCSSPIRFHSCTYANASPTPAPICCFRNEEESQDLRVGSVPTYETTINYSACRSIAYTTSLL